MTQSPSQSAAGRHAREIADVLRARNETLAIAETSAGGLISATFIAVPGASSWFVGGVVAYGTTLRREWLGAADVPEGTVSAPMAVRLATEVRDRTGATWGLGETGIAGPQTGRRSAKQAGLGFVAVLGPNGRFLTELSTDLGDREANMRHFASEAIAFFLMVTQRGADRSA